MGRNRKGPPPAKPGYDASDEAWDDWQVRYDAWRSEGGSGNRRNNGGWTPRTFGLTEDGEPVTFRLGLGSNEDHTLISDDEKSDRAFRAGHNHYGPRREGNGRVEDEEDRGYYTGRGH